MAGLKFLITGDDSPIRKTLKKLKEEEAADMRKAMQSVTDITDTEKKKRKEVIATINEETAAIKKRNAEAIKSNSAAEVAAYQSSKTPSGSGSLVATPSKNDLIAQFKAINDQQTIITANYEAGRVSAQQYGKTIDALSAKQAELRQAIATYGQAQTVASETTTKNSTEVKRQQGLIEKLSAELKTYKEQRSALTAVEVAETDKLAILNQRIAENEAAMKRLNNVGKAGFDDFGNAIERPVGKLERLKYAANEFAKMSATSTNPAIIEKYNRKLQETQEEIGRVSNVGKKGFDELGNKIKSSGSVLGKLWGSLKTVANILPGIGIAGLLAFAVEPLINYLSKLDLFKEKLTQAKLAVKTLTEALASSEYSGAVKSIQQLRGEVDLARQGFLDKKEVVKKYNETIGTTAGLAKDLNDIEQFLAKNADNYVKMTLYKAAANLALEEAAKKAYEAEQTRLKKESEFNSAIVEGNSGGTSMFGVTGGSYISQESLRQQEKLAAEGRRRRKAEQIKEIEDEKKKQETIASNFQKQAAKLAKESDFNFFGTNGNGDGGKNATTIENQYQSALSKRQGIIDSIAKLSDEFNRKQLSQEEEGRQAVIDRFTEMRRQLIEYNKFAERYNKTAAPGKKVSSVDLGVLDPIQQKGLEDYDAKIEIDKAKVASEQMKEVYRQYEDYRTEYGKEAADQRFRQELQGASSYVEYLRKQLDSVVWKDDAKSNKLKDLYTQELNQAQLSESKATFDQLIKMVSNYEDKRKGIEERYAKLRAAARDQTDISILNENQKQELRSLDDSNVQKLDAYKALYEGVEDLSDRAAKKVIADARAMLDGLVKAGKISPELARDISRSINTAESSLADRFPQRLSQVAGQLQNIAGTVGQIDEGFANMIGTLANVVGSVSNLSASINAIRDAQKKGGAAGILGSLAGGLGVVGAGIGIVSAISGVFANAERKRAEEARYANEFQLKQTNAITSALERQISALDNVFGTERVEKYSKALEDTKKQYDDLSNSINGKLQLTGDKDFDTYIGLANSGDEYYKKMLKPFIDKGVIKTITIDADITDAEEQIEKLRTLLEGGSLDKKTANDVQNVIKQFEIYQSTLNNLRQETIGASFSEITDSIVKMFQDGTTAAEDFGKNFEQIMQKSLLNSFKRKYLEEGLQDFYKDFAKYTSDESGGALDKNEIEALRKKYNDVITNAQGQFQALQEATGIKFGSDTDNSKPSPNSLEGAYSTASQESITLLAGQTAGMRIAQLETNATLKAQTPLLQQQLEISMQGIRVQQQIEANTAATVVVLKEYLPYLQKIDNRMSTSSNQAKAAGF